CGGQDETFPKTPDEPQKVGRKGAGGEVALPVAFDEEAAKATYVSATCSGCHAVDMTGAVGPDLTAIGGKYTPEEILNIVTNGKGAMPANLVEDADERGNLVAWLASLK
ncbi:MAG: cytochrome c, partial [Bacilli bacterium]